jgi:hypothetical protein
MISQFICLNEISLYLLEQEAVVAVVGTRLSVAWYAK